MGRLASLVDACCFSSALALAVIVSVFENPRLTLGLAPVSSAGIETRAKPTRPDRSMERLNSSGDKNIATTPPEERQRPLKPLPVHLLALTTPSGERVRAWSHR